jgi:hypothetical protein
MGYVLGAPRQVSLLRERVALSPLYSAALPPVDLPAGTGSLLPVRRCRRPPLALPQSPATPLARGSFRQQQQ